MSLQFLSQNTNLYGIVFFWSCSLDPCLTCVGVFRSLRFLVASHCAQGCSGGQRGLHPEASHQNCGHKWTWCNTPYASTHVNFPSYFRGLTRQVFGTMAKIKWFVYSSSVSLAQMFANLLFLIMSQDSQQPTKLSWQCLQPLPWLASILF